MNTNDNDDWKNINLTEVDWRTLLGMCLSQVKVKSPVPIEYCCDRCGWVCDSRQCKIICENCGCQLDCSDLFKE